MKGADRDRRNLRMTVTVASLCRASMKGADRDRRNTRRDGVVVDVGRVASMKGADRDRRNNRTNQHYVSFFFEPQ